MQRRKSLERFDLAFHRRVHDHRLLELLAPMHHPHRCQGDILVTRAVLACLLAQPVQQHSGRIRKALRFYVVRFSRLAALHA